MQRRLWYLALIACWIPSLLAAQPAAEIEVGAGRHAPSLLANGGFEARVGGLPEGWQAEGAARAVDVAGRRAVRLTGTPDGPPARLRQVYRRGVTPGTWYRVSAEVRAEEVTRAPAWRLYWYDAADQLLGVERAQGPVGAAWATLAREVEAPPRAVQMTFELRHAGGGTSWWDDVRLAPLPRLENLGPKVFDLHHRNGVVVGHHLYIISESRARMGVIDLRTGRREQLIEMERGGALAGLLHSSGDVYFGVRGLLRLDPETRAVTYLDQPVARIQSLEEGPDGVLWGTTYPAGDLFSYDPATDTFHNYGMVQEGYRYGNDVIHCGGRMFVGIGSPALLFTYDPAAGVGEQILPEAYRAQSHVRFFECAGAPGAGERLFAVLNTAGQGLVIDPKTLETVDVLPAVGSHGYAPPDARRRVFYTADGRLHYYDLDDGTTASVDAEQHFGNAVSFAWVELGLPDFPGPSLVGVERYGHWWIWNPETGRARRTATDLPHLPYKLETIHLGPDGRLYGVGHIGSGSFVTDLADPYGHTQMEGPGQAEGMTSVGDTLYFGVYTKARFYQQPVDAPWDPEPIFNLTEMEQNRPFVTLSADDKFYSGTIPLRGVLGGAFAEYDPATGRLRAWRNLSPDQAITAAAVRNGYAYLGTSRSGGLSSRPTTEEGRLLVFNLQAEEVEQSIVPIPGEPAVGALAFGPDSLLWGLTKGRLFRYDPVARRVVETRVLFEGARWNPPDHNWGYGESLLWARDGTLFATDGTRLFHYDPATREAEILFADGVVRPVEGPDGRIWFIGGPKKTLYRYNR